MLNRTIESYKRWAIRRRFNQLALIDQSCIVSPLARITNLNRRRESIVVGGHSCIKGELLLYGHGGNIAIGSHCYVGEGSRIWSADKIVIGDRVLISHGVEIHDSSAHSKNPAERHAHFAEILRSGLPKSSPPGIKSAPIIIGDDAWISFNTVILSGVRIGRGAIVAAGSIVTSDVPDFCIYRNQVIPIISPIEPSR